MTKTEVLLIILGGIFVIEALSVLIQVFSFQTFRKRVFKMAPIHHHFELEAWSETKIILRFWIVAAVCSRSVSRFTSSPSRNCNILCNKSAQTQRCCAILVMRSGSVDPFERSPRHGPRPDARDRRRHPPGAWMSYGDVAAAAGGKRHPRPHAQPALHP